MLFQSLAFLFAAGAIALPIYLHLAKRNKPKQAPFPSLRFVEQAPVPTRRRFIPMHWLLLLLRCLAIILIALAFAQPYFPRSTVPLESKRVLLVDDSYSMQSEGLAAVTRKLNEMIDTASPEEPILIGLVSDHVRWMESFSGNPAGARFWLEENWKKNDVSDFKPAIQQASQQLGSQDLGSREIHVFTDGQLLPWKRFDLDAFQLEPGIELSIHSPDLDHSERANLSVQAVSISEEPAGEKSRYFIDIALKNHSAKLSEGEIEIYFSGQRVSAADFSIEPSGLYQSRARFSGDSFKLQHGHIQVRTNDSLSVDNRRCFSINSRAKPIVFRQPHAEFFDYFGAVFNRGVWANRCEYYDLSDSTHRDKITDASLILLVRGGETLAPEVIAEIERAVKQGATLFISGNQASESFNDFEAIEFLNVKESKGADQFSEIDFSHPIFKSYREMPTRDLRALVFHDTLELERTRESQAVANFAGKPAIVE
ncbi:MAG: vWA domain-containing protein, partial [Opitutales bacterium]